MLTALRDLIGVTINAPKMMSDPCLHGCIEASQRDLERRHCPGEGYATTLRQLMERRSFLEARARYQRLIKERNRRSLAKGGKKC